MERYTEWMAPPSREIVLNNADGTWTPENGGSVYQPLISKGLLVRCARWSAAPTTNGTSATWNQSGSKRAEWDSARCCRWSIRPFSLDDRIQAAAAEDVTTD